MGSAASHVYRVPEFTDLQRSHDEIIIHADHERSRCETMKAVLRCHSQETPNDLHYLMAAYTQWLLTAKKITNDGRPMNRWTLMTAFVETQLIL
jgi:hypothetical protein